jgi:HSP20 family molecular chaperone IbpA
MSRNLWWIIALLFAVLCFDNFLQALNWFHDDSEGLEKVSIDSKQQQDESLFEKAKQGAKTVVENVASGGKKAKESIEDTGKKAASTISQSYQENIAKPLRHWTHGNRDEDLLSAAPWSHWFDSSRPWTHSVASLGQFRTFPNEYIVYLDMPGVPKEEIEIFVRGHRLRVHGTHGTCLAGTGEIDRFCLERQVDRSFTIPEDVIFDHIEALMKDGVLMLKLPRLQDEDSSDEGDDNEGGITGIFGGKRSKLKGKKIHVKDYKPTWRERAREAGEAVKDTFKKNKKN